MAKPSLIEVAAVADFLSRSGPSRKGVIMDGQPGGIGGVHRWRTATLLVAVLMVFLPGACTQGSGGSEAGASKGNSTTTGAAPSRSTTEAEAPTSIATATTTSKFTGEEAEVEAALLSAMSAYFDRLASPSRESIEEIARWHGGQSLLVVTEEAVRMLEAGQSARPGVGGAPIPVVTRVQVDGDSAGLFVCLVDDMVVVDADGSPVNDTIATKEYRVLMVKDAGNWKVMEALTTSRREGRFGCV